MKLKTIIITCLLATSGGYIQVSATAAADHGVDPALELIHTFGCKGCHSIQGDGSSTAPDLTNIGSRMTVNQIKGQLTAPVESRSGGFMPSYKTLSEHELDLISQYLYNLR